MNSNTFCSLHRPPSVLRIASVRCDGAVLQFLNGFGLSFTFQRFAKLLPASSFAFRAGQTCGTVSSTDGCGCRTAVAARPAHRLLHLFPSKKSYGLHKFGGNFAEFGGIRPATAELPSCQDGAIRDFDVLGHGRDLSVMTFCDQEQLGMLRTDRYLCIQQVLCARVWLLLAEPSYLVAPMVAQRLPGCVIYQLPQLGRRCSCRIPSTSPFPFPLCPFSMAFHFLSFFGARA